MFLVLEIASIIKDGFNEKSSKEKEDKSTRNNKIK